MKKALLIATVGDFLAGFELEDMQLLQRQEYEVHCAANFNGITNLRDQKMTDIGIIKHHIPFSRNPFSIDNFIAYKDLKSLISTERFNLVHCHTPVAGILGRIAAHKKKVQKIIYTAHGFHFYTGAPAKNWIIYYPVEKLCSRYTDVLVTINKEDYERASKRFYAEKTVYIPGVGLDTMLFTTGDGKKVRSEFGIRDSDFMLLSIGELNTNKNHETVIKAIAGLNMVYVIAGKGQQAEQLKATADKYGVKLILAGYRTDIIDFYAAADAYILPSIREGLNVSLMEAMASGLPCCCSKIRGNVDLIDKNGGYLFMPTDIEGIREAVEAVMAADREKLGQYNQEKIKRFDRTVVNELMRKIYTGEM